MFSISGIGYCPNPEIETHLRIQVIDVHKELTKTKYTLLVMWIFANFLGALKACVIIVFSISGIGYCNKLSKLKLKHNYFYDGYNNNYRYHQD